MVGQWHARRPIRRDSCPKSVGRFRTGFGFGWHARILRSAGHGNSCAVRNPQVPARPDRDGATILILALQHSGCEVSYRVGNLVGWPSSSPLLLHARENSELRSRRRRDEPSAPSGKSMGNLTGQTKHRPGRIDRSMVRLPPADWEPMGRRLEV